MTLRKLARKHWLGVGPAGRRKRDPNGAALTFVLNRDFLPGLKMLAYSMIEAGTLLDLPVSFITDEKDLLDDRFVRALGDTTRLVTADEIAEFAVIPSSRIPDSVRLEWIPKYTFLKWTIFDHSPFDRLIWIDADILCLRPIDHLPTLADADLYAAPTFSLGPLVGADAENRLPWEQRRDNLHAFIDDPHRHGETLNSGVMVVNKRLLDPAFRTSLIKWATENEVRSEQTVVRRVLDGSDTLTRKPLSPSDNFHARYLRYLSPGPRAQLLEKIALLHYVGADQKPWDAQGELDTPTRMWWEMQQEAARRRRTFRMQPPASFSEKED